jgi:iron complex outermembrane recepter protein
MSNANGISIHRVVSRLSSIGLTFALASGSAWGQSAPHSMDELQEVVVTATRRDTSLEKTPLSMSAVAGPTLADAGAQDLNSLVQLSPGITFITQSPADTRIVIRGIYSPGEATVGLYYDETPVTGAVGSDNDAGSSTPLAQLFDVDRIEVLRGPQGTLFGAGSMGGTVRVIYNKPTFSYEGAVDTDVSTTQGGGGNYGAEGMVNLPLISDKLAARLVVFDNTAGGYVDDTFLNQKNINSYKSQGGRLQLRFQPTDKLTVDGSYLYQSTAGQIGWWEPGAGNYISTAQMQMPTDDRFSIFNLTARWDLGHVIATAVTSYMSRDNSNAPTDTSPFFETYLNPPTCAAFAGAPCTSAQLSAFYAHVNTVIPSQIQPHQTITSPTAEFRLSSADPGFLDWTVGAFYSKRYNKLDNQVVSGNAANGAPNPGPELYDRKIDDTLKQYAGFGESTAHLTNKLALTFGARYFDFTRDVGGSIPIGLDLIGAADTPYAKNSSSESGWVTKTNLSYQIDPDFLVYTSASQGFRPGGVNQVIGLPAALTPYESDKLWDYEVGAKSNWFNHRLSVDLDGFFINWTNMQVTGLTPDGLFQFITNAGAAHVKGLELVVTAVPVENLEIQANGTSTSATLTQNQENASVLGSGVVGDRIPYTPKLTAGISATYRWAMSSSFGGMARISENYVGSSNSEFNNSDGYQTELPSYSLTGVRIGIEAPDRNWGVYFYSTNLFNRVAITYSDAYAINLGVNQVTSLPPRVVGVNLRKTF